jgi:hypothetical protein
MARDVGLTEGGIAPSTVIDIGTPDVPNAPTIYDVEAIQTTPQANLPTQQAMTPTEQAALSQGQIPVNIYPYQDPVITQGQSAYMNLFGVPYNPYVGPISPWDESADAAAVAQANYLAEPGIETIAGGAGTRYTGRSFYQGGSEQAYLGPIWQAQAAFGLLSPEEIGFLGVDTALPSHLNPAQTRILTDNGVPPEVIEELFDFDPDTGFWFRTSYDELGEVSAGGYGAYSYGYPAYGGGGGRYGYPSYGGGSYAGGLINWRIGI